jgi:tRNA (cytidine/uridine-2'-O-)-methyltransferase
MGRKHNVFVSDDDRAAKDHKLTKEGALTIVLLNPRIPQNTGSIARMCAASGSKLELINPFFKIDDAKLIRAGLDYWPLLDVKTYENASEWFEKNAGVTPWLVEVTGERSIYDAPFARNDTLVFGDEQDGITQSWVERFGANRVLRIPQVNVRSLNLATSVGIVAYEAYRQIGWWAESGS